MPPDDGRAEDGAGALPTVDLEKTLGVTVGDGPVDLGRRHLPGVDRDSGGLGLVWLIQQRSRTLWLGALGAGALVVVIALATRVTTRRTVLMLSILVAFYTCVAALGLGQLAYLHV